MPIFRVNSVKIYTGQKNLHRHVCGVCDKYQVWGFLNSSNAGNLSDARNVSNTCNAIETVYLIFCWCIIYQHFAARSVYLAPSHFMQKITRKLTHRCQVPTDLLDKVLIFRVPRGHQLTF